MSHNDFDLSAWQPPPQPTRRPLPPAAEAAIGLGTGCLFVVAAEAVLLALAIHAAMHFGTRTPASKPVPKSPPAIKAKKAMLPGTPDFKSDTGNCQLEIAETI